MSAAIATDPGGAGDTHMAIACLAGVVLAHMAVLALLPAGAQPPARVPARVSVTLIVPPEPAAAAPKPAARAEQRRPVPPRKPEPERAAEPPAVRAPSPPLAQQPSQPLLGEPATALPGPAAPSGEVEAAPPAAAAASAPAPALPGAGAAGASAAERSETPKAPVVPARYDAAYLDNPKPEYPRLARRLGEQGTVLLNVYVGAGGAPEKIEMRKSSGSPRLDQAARETVARWRFVPARQGDRSIGAWLIVPITFVLEG